MNVKFVLCWFCTGLLLKISETHCTTVFPRITEPYNNSCLKVKPYSKIDLYCKAVLDDNSTVPQTAIIFWVINGKFTEECDNVYEDKPVVIMKGEVSSILHILKVVPEFYNIPFTCMIESTSGTDKSSIFLKKMDCSGLFLNAILM
ncbi:interleukin-1 receptor type 1-like [Pelobates cultripes]|uniref:Interleukin-1 receptor type 1-like n=1 Tax=Pelobates cultripes TaxID=61616 RepID=A0AAD1R4U2_PELCU|nr:interleukin-1 receptor type 1-like [Pelobates cultripes]